MPTEAFHCSSGATSSDADDELTAGTTATHLIAQHNCRRPGLRANPPAINLSICNWFRRR